MVALVDSARGRPPVDALDDEGCQAASSVSVRKPLIETIGPPEIMAPLPPIRWLAEGLRLVSGAAIAFCGYGFSGKSLLAQSIALAVASGTRIFDIFGCRTGRSLYLDYDGQGQRLTSERFQRLARGAGIGVEDLGDRLQLATLPSAHLDDEGAADFFTRACEGYDLVVVDALRGAAPHSDENSSEIRKPIDVLNRVAEKTGATVILVHHSRKPDKATNGADPSLLSQFSVRGSSAIFDACASVFMLMAVKGAPIRVRQTKCRLTGTPLDEFGYQIADLDIDNDPRGGLRLVHLEPEQLRELRQQADSGAPQIAEVSARIRTELEKHPNGFQGTKTELYKMVGAKKERCVEALSLLVQIGDVVITKKPPRIELRHTRESRRAAPL